MKTLRALFIAFLLLPAVYVSAETTEPVKGNSAQNMAGGCNAEFAWVDSVGYVFFVNSSSLGSSGIYLWDFGDGNYSNQEHPSNMYANPGVYQVCLVALDSFQNFCDSTCHFVTAVSTPPATGVNEIKIVSAVSLTPNPSSEGATFSFSLAEAGNAAITICDMTGREVAAPVNREFSPGKQQLAIDTQTFAAGTYIVQINVNGQSVKSRLVVAHP